MREGKAKPNGDQIFLLLMHRHTVCIYIFIDLILTYLTSVYLKVNYS